MNIKPRTIKSEQDLAKTTEGKIGARLGGRGCKVPKYKLPPTYFAKKAGHGVQGGMCDDDCQSYGVIMNDHCLCVLFRFHYNEKHGRTRAGKKLYRVPCRPFYPCLPGVQIFEEPDPDADGAYDGERSRGSREFAGFVRNVWVWMLWMLMLLWCHVGIVIGEMILL